MTLRSTITALALTTLLGACGPDRVFESSSAPPPPGEVTTSSSTSTSDTSTSSDVMMSNAASDEDGVSTERRLPGLVVTNEPPPDIIYRRGSRDTVLANDDTAEVLHKPITPMQPVETVVTRKITELGRDLSQLQGAVGGFQDRLNALQSKNDALASQYYSLIASIETELQSGTTPGNPVLTERWNVAQSKLDTLAESTGLLNQLATDLSSEASKAAFLQSNVRATYGLSGAVKEDHKNLQQLEDRVNQNLVAISRLLTTVSDEITRRGSYLRAEHLNMQTLASAVTRGELYGQNMSNTLFRRAAESGREIFNDPPASAESDMTGESPKASTSSRRPLVIIRFDRPNVNYEQAVYAAVSQALEKYPSAKFDLVAVSPSEGNPAQIALSETEARKHGEAVLRSLNQMGLPMERVSLNAANSGNVTGNEVHIYLQ